MNISEALAYTALITGVATFFAPIFPATALTDEGRFWGVVVVAFLGVITMGLFAASVWTGVQW